MHGPVESRFMTPIRWGILATGKIAGAVVMLAAGAGHESMRA